MLRERHKTNGQRWAWFVDGSVPFFSLREEKGFFDGTKNIKNGRVDNYGTSTGTLFENDADETRFSA